MHSPNDMMVDSQDEYVVQPGENVKESVAIINPDQLDDDADQLENPTLATDRTCRARRGRSVQRCDTLTRVAQTRP